MYIKLTKKIKIKFLVKITKRETLRNIYMKNNSINNKILIT